MKGYTIENSIDLLEKDVKALKEGGGGGGASTWNQLTNKPFNTLGEEFHTLSGALTLRELSSDKVKLPDSEAYTWEDVSEAVDGLATEQAAVDEELSHINEDIVDLTTNVNSLSTSKQDKLTAGANISIENNVVSAVVSGVVNNYCSSINDIIQVVPNIYDSTIIVTSADLSNTLSNNRSPAVGKLLAFRLNAEIIDLFGLISDGVLYAIRLTNTSVTTSKRITLGNQ